MDVADESFGGRSFGGFDYVYVIMLVQAYDVGFPILHPIPNTPELRKTDPLPWKASFPRSQVQQSVSVFLRDGTDSSPREKPFGVRSLDRI